MGEVGEWKGWEGWVGVWVGEVGWREVDWRGGWVGEVGEGKGLVSGLEREVGGRGGWVSEVGYMTGLKISHVYKLTLGSILHSEVSC